MLLSILIPTYNREPFLIKNLLILSDYIKKSGKEDEVEIIISNNCSTDDTHHKVNEFKFSNPVFNIKYYSQERNLGLEKNALFVLSKSDAEYIMYLGDDDFIDYDYFLGVIDCIEKNKNIHCIIPNFIPIDIEGNQIGSGRDDLETTKEFDKGFDNCLINSQRGHQLSGLVLLTDGLLDSYHKFNISNIYLFIFFVSYRCLTGNTYLFVDYPVSVTQPGQEKKDWGYGNDGLINEVFDNYIKLPLNTFQKTKLQVYLIYKQRWRLLKYKKIGFKHYLDVIINVWLSKNGTFLFKIIFPVMFTAIDLRIRLKYLINKK